MQTWTPHARRWVVAAVLLRSGASVAALVTLYYLAPLDRVLDIGTWIGFAFVLLASSALLGWQVRAVFGSNRPLLRALQAISVGLSLLLLLFASTYIVIAHSASGSFNEALSRTDALYFTLTVFTTVGFGDIVPLTEIARIATMIQMVMDLVAVGLVAKIVLAAAQQAVRRRDRAAAGDAGGQARSDNVPPSDEPRLRATSAAPAAPPGSAPRPVALTVPVREAKR